MSETTDMERNFRAWAERAGMNLKQAHDGTYVFRPAFYAWLGWRAGLGMDTRYDCYGTSLPPISESDGALYASVSRSEKRP